MKKILCVFDGAHFSHGAINFAKSLNEYEPILLTGVFLPPVDYSDVMIYYLGGLAGPIYIPQVDEDREVIAKSIADFKELCAKHSIECRVHVPTDMHILEALRKETRYADLLVLSSELFYSNLGDESQEDYLNDTMHKAECPVVLVPENYVLPQSIIIAYDGSASSVFALKQFAYLFPELSEVSTLVVYASPKDEAFPDLPYIEELAARHFKDLTFYKLDIDPKKYFNTWLSEKGNAMLVTGSYGRSSFSELFKKNFSEEVLADHKLPIFIAHQ